MAFPTIEFNSVHPFLMKGGVETEVHLSVVTNTVGKSQFSLSLTAPSCTFLDGSQEINQEIETTTASELTEVALSIVIISKISKVLVIRLIAEIVNTDGESDKSRLIVRLDNREGIDASSVHPASSPGAIVASTTPLNSDTTPEAKPEIEDSLEHMIPPSTETAVDANPTVNSEADDTFEATVTSIVDAITTAIPEVNSDTDSNSTTNPA